jgi:hypothetical protein
MGEKPAQVTPDAWDPGQPVSTGDRSESSGATSEATPEPAEIRADIERTRAEMSETIEAIQEKLSPQRVMEQAKETVRDATVGRIKNMVETATDTAGDLADQVQDTAKQAVYYVRENSMPAALIGAGIAWLLMRSRGNEPRNGYATSGPERIRGVYRWPESYSSPNFARREGWLETVTNNPGPAAIAGLSLGYLLMRRGSGESGRWTREGATGRWTTVRPGASPLTEQGRRTVGDVARQTQAKVGEVAERVQEGWDDYSRRAENEFDRWMRENPLTVGAAALALGAAVGLSAPRTKTEDAWMGEARDAVVERAQEAAQETVDQAQRVVEKMGDKADPSAPRA